MPRVEKMNSHNVSETDDGVRLMSLEFVQPFFKGGVGVSRMCPDEIARRKRSSSFSACVSGLNSENIPPKLREKQRGQ
jgi:hypothetical protein